MARRIRRRFRGGRVVDAPAGHGLLAWILLLLDATSPGALCVDRRRPKSAPRLERALLAEWPHLEGKVRYEERPLAEVDLAPGDLVCSVHACGALTDEVLTKAAAARARVAVLPCCQDASRNDTADLEGWLEPRLAIDVARANRLRQAGYRIWTRTIPPEITPQNRLLLGQPEV